MAIKIGALPVKLSELVQECCAHVAECVVSNLKNDSLTIEN